MIQRILARLAGPPGAEGYVLCVIVALCLFAFVPLALSQEARYVQPTTAECEAAGGCITVTREVFAKLLRMAPCGKQS